MHVGAAFGLGGGGVEPGDEVILPDLTWIASAAPVTYVGATPVFADVDERTWCLSAESVRACYGKHQGNFTGGSVWRRARL